MKKDGPSPARGDHVYVVTYPTSLKLKNVAAKLCTKVRGPFEILTEWTPNCYRIQNLESGEIEEHNVRNLLYRSIPQEAKTREEQPSDPRKGEEVRRTVSCEQNAVARSTTEPTSTTILLSSPSPCTYVSSLTYTAVITSHVLPDRDVHSTGYTYHHYPYNQIEPHASPTLTTPVTQGMVPANYFLPSFANF